MADFDPFSELQLSPDAEPELIKAAFKALAKKYHPDKYSNPAEKAAAEKKMARINEAQRLIQEGYRPKLPDPVKGEAPFSTTDSVSLSSESRAPNPGPISNPKSNAHKSNTGSPIVLLIAGALVLLATLGSKYFATDHLQKALELEKQGQLQDSLHHLNQAVKNDPHKRELYLYRAKLWEKLGEPEKAAIDFKNGEPATTLSIPTDEPEAEDSAENQVPDTGDENPDTDVPRT